MKLRRRLIMTILLIAAMVSVAILSLLFGSRQVGFADVMAAFGLSDAETYGSAIIQARIPRTIFGLMAGAALAVSGGLMQSITRNPIADPSILGVNTGASLAVVCGMSFFGITSNFQYVSFAFVGAMLTAVAVYGMASLGYDGATPMKLALAGAAAATALQSLVNTVMLPNGSVMDQFRFWQTGSIGGATWSDIRTLGPVIIIGLILSICLSGHLNAIALGDEMATGLGINVPLIRACAALVGVLLCASVTALAGPIGFIGLMIPHFIRLVTGPDMRWNIPLSALAGGALLVFADVLGRVFGGTSELEVGIVTALIGAPVFILIVRKVKVRKL